MKNQITKFIQATGHLWASAFALMALVILAWTANAFVPGATQAATPSPIHNLRIVGSTTSCSTGLPPLTYVIAERPVRICWDMDDMDLSGAWSVELYIREAEDNINRQIAVVPLNNGQPQFVNHTFDLTDVSMEADPNPFDRTIHALLVNNNQGGESYDTVASYPFAIMPWMITDPNGDTLVMDSDFTIRWTTELAGRANVYIRITTDNAVINIPIKQIDHLSDLGLNWKVGYRWNTLTNAWDIPLDNLIGNEIHFYLVPLDEDENDSPSGYYKGYDTNMFSTDQQPPFFITNVGQSLEITAPAASPVPTYTWGQTNQSITAQYSGDATGLKFVLMRPAQPVGGPHFAPITLVESCPINGSGVSTCSFNIPNKPVDAPDGSGYQFAVSEVGSTIDPSLIVFRGVIINSVVEPDPTVDFSFDTAKGINGFEFSPLVFDPSANEKVDVSVWVNYTDTDGKPSEATNIRASLGFGDDNNWAEVDDVDISVAGGIPAGESRLVYLGQFTGDARYWNYKLNIDNTNVIPETNETNNELFGELTSGNPGIDTNAYKVNLQIVTLDPNAEDPNNRQFDLAVIPRTIISAVVNSLPVGERVLSGRVTLEYDATKMSPLTDTISSGQYGTATYNAALSTAGELVVDFTLDPDNYPSGGLFGLWYVDWTLLDTGVAIQSIKSTRGGLENDGTDIWLTNPGPDDKYGDLYGGAAADLDISINGIAKELSATYLSQEFSVASSSRRFERWKHFRAVFNDQLSTQGLTTDTKFALGFFNASGVNICTISGNQCGGPLFDQDGYFLVPVEKSYNALDPETGEIDLSILNGFTWKSQVRSVQIRIDMYSSNHYGPADAQPWVQSAAIGYEYDLLGEVGLIRSGNSVINVARGNSVSYNFVIERSDATFPSGTCPVTWSVVPGQTGNTDITWTPDDGTVTIDNTTPSQNVTVTVAASPNAQLNIPYPFTLEATTCDPSKTFRSLPVNVNVTGSASSQFSLAISPAVGDIDEGESVTFTITPTRQPGFTNAIVLSDNLSQIFVDDEIDQITYNPTNRTIPAGSSTPVTITIAAANDVPTGKTGTMTITGTSGADSSGVSAQLSIADDNGGGDGGTKTITLELTAPVDGGNNTAQPVFTFRLYNSANAKVFDKADIRTTQNKATVTIPNLTVGSTYRGFMRSTRHLWREGNANLVISDATNTYTMSFTTLLSGDIDHNNTVNAIDVPVFSADWLKTGTQWLGDFDGNGAVNALDPIYIYKNLFKTGDQEPS